MGCPLRQPNKGSVVKLWLLAHFGQIPAAKTLLVAAIFAILVYKSVIIAGNTLQIV